jgi:hypothetical protein
MAVWYSLWPFVIFFPIWNVWTKKNLATLTKMTKILIETVTPDRGTTHPASPVRLRRHRSGPLDGDPLHRRRLPLHLGSILRNPVLAENFLDNFLSSNFGQN